MSENIEEVEKKPLVKIILFKPKESFYRKSPEERINFTNSVIDKQKEFGVKTLIPFCKCFYTNEEWTHFAVEEYPDLETLEKYNDWVFSVGMQRDWESRVYLGPRMTAEELMELNTMNP